MQSFRRSLEGLSLPALLVGRDLRVHYANGAAHALLGYGAGDLRGLPMESLLGPHRHGELRNFEELLRGGAARRVRSVLRHDSGSFTHVSLMLTPCVEHGGVVAVSVRIESASAASASASAAARSSRPPAGASVPPRLGAPPVPNLHPTPDERSMTPTKPFRPALSQREQRMHDTLPEVMDSLPPRPRVEPVERTGVTERPWRISEERLATRRTIPASTDLLGAELLSKLRSMRERCKWLERRLQQLQAERPLDPLAQREMQRIVQELRALVERSMELTRELRGLPARESSG